MRGLFITLEGGDGAGKSTQIRNIEKFFAEKGMTVTHTREPGGPPIAEKLRAILLDPANKEMHAVTEMLITRKNISLPRKIFGESLVASNVVYHTVG